MRTLSSVAGTVRPLERKLPLLIAGLLLAVLGTFGWLLNRELRAASEMAAGDRLTVAAQRVAALLIESTVQGRHELRSVADDPSILGYIDHRDTASRARVLAILGQQRSGVPASRALWLRDCTLLASQGPLASSPALNACPSVDLIRRSWLQPMSARGDTALYITIAPVVRGGVDTVGFLQQVRVMGGSSTSAQRIGSLIGTGVRVLVGNAAGAPVWTDLARVVDGPPAGLQRGSPVRYTAPNGDPQLGVALNLASTPWVLWVAMPMTDVLANVYNTLLKLALLGAGCLLFGVVGAWLVSNHVTRPIAALTRASEAIASGDYSARLVDLPHDELGKLMSTFNRMAEQVQAANRELAAQATDLQHHYRESQELARALELANQELHEAAEEARGAISEKEIAQALLDDVLTQAPVGIGMFDQELRYLRLNPALAAMNGMLVEEHLGHTPRSLTRSLGTVSESCLRKVMETGEAVDGQTSEGVGPGGVKKHWLASYFPVRGSGGEVRGAAAVVLDTTTHRDLESQLLQAQKMDAVGQLAGGVAHDFNNLLTVISSYSQIALETLNPADPLYADMTEIRGAADRASRLTRQLLAFSRKQVLQPRTLDLNFVASEMENMLHRLIGEDVTLVLDLAQDVGDVRADPGQVEQVLMNLVVNARDAMPGGGRLVIATRNVSVTHEQKREGEAIPPGDYVTMSVIDSGTGMSAETRSHLFEPFFTTKETGQGTGLGLSTVFGIVKQSGGEMRVESAPGMGSTFTMYLPRILRPAEHAPRASGAHAALGGTETILLVEDDVSLRTLARRVLVAAGYSVLEARTAQAAIEFGGNYRGEIDLLLTDVVMPQQNGREVAARLHDLRPGLRTLFMSGYTDDDVIRRGVVLSQSEFLQKPFTPDELLRKIRDVLDHRAMLKLA